MIENEDYFVRLVNFPTCACGGVVMLNDDGTYTILLNARLSRQQNEESMAHELRHIRRGDLFSAAPAKAIEEAI